MKKDINKNTKTNKVLNDIIINFHFDMSKGLTQDNILDILKKSTLKLKLDEKYFETVQIISGTKVVENIISLDINEDNNELIIIAKFAVEVPQNADLLDCILKFKNNEGRECLKFFNVKVIEELKSVNSKAKFFVISHMNFTESDIDQDFLASKLVKVKVYYKNRSEIILVNKDMMSDITLVDNGIITSNNNTVFNCMSYEIIES